MPAGRPTLYDPKYCAEIVAFMGQGYSKSAFAGHIGVCRDTLDDWAAKDAEFLRATKEGAVARVEFLEKRLIGETTASPQITAMIFALKNAMPAEWRDRHEHVGADGGPIAVTVARFTGEGE
jgi:hypothetical protein